MSLLATKIRTALALGLPNLIRVANFRWGVRFGWNRARRLQATLPAGPYFTCGILDGQMQPAVPGDWWNEALYFGRWPVVMSDAPPDWHANPLTRQRVSDPDRPWWKIPDFDPSVGDIKTVWEASRLDWVVRFAQRTVQGDSAALDRLNSWLADWCKQNPAYTGPNWKCGQEASIRVMHLAMASLVLGCAKSPVPAMMSLVKAHLQRILPTLGYAVGQDNNHGTSEAAALYMGGMWLAAVGDGDGRRYALSGRRWLENRMARLIAEDGSFSQYSLSYHRVLLDTLSMVEVWRRHFSDASFSERFLERAKAATHWMLAMIIPETGDGPNLGANDGAQLLPMTQTDYRDFRPSTQLATALFCDAKAYPEDMGVSGSIAWLGVKPSTGSLASLFSRRFDDGGYGVLRMGRAFAMMRYPRFRFRPSHADALHVDLWANGENLLRDAGSYGYNVEARWLNYFSGTQGHNTIQFDDRDQMPRLGRFLFGDWLRTSDVDGPLTISEGERFAASYRDRTGLTHKRTMTLSNGGLRVEDEVQGFTNKAVLRWCLKPGAWVMTGSHISCDGHFLTITSDVPIRRIELVEGWESRYYLEKAAVPVLEVEIGQPGNLVSNYSWGVGSE